MAVMFGGPRRIVSDCAVTVIQVSWLPQNRTANMLLHLLLSQKRNCQPPPSWVHPPNTINLAGRAKRHGGRTLTLKISRGNWRVFARRNVHSGACFISQTFFPPSSNVIYRLALQKKTDSELFIVDTKGDDKGMHSPSLTNYLT
jgi:hypothetical protein